MWSCPVCGSEHGKCRGEHLHSPCFSSRYHHRDGLSGAEVEHALAGGNKPPAEGAGDAEADY